MLVSVLKVVIKPVPIDMKVVQKNIHGLYHPVRVTIAPAEIAPTTRERTIGRVLIPDRTALVPLTAWNQRGR